MSLAPRSADPPRDLLISDVEITHPLQAQLTGPLGLRARIHEVRRFIDRARSDSLFRNSLYNLANSVAAAGFGYLFWLLAARLCSPATVGLTAAATSAATIITAVSSLGVGGTLIQSLPGQQKKTEWSATFWAGMATTTLFAVALCATGLAVLPLMSRELMVLRHADYAAVFAVGTVAMTVGVTLDCVCMAERRASYAFCRNASSSAAKVLLLGLLTLTFGPDAFDLLGAWGVAAAFGLGLGVALLIRNIGVARPPEFSVLLRTARRFRSRLTGNQLIGMGAVLLPYLLPILVTARLGARDNAYFYTTWMLAGLFLTIAPAFSVSLFAEGMHQPERLGALARSASKIIGAILVPGLLTILVLGGTLLSAFGHDYTDNAVGLLRLAVLASIPDAVTNVYVAVLRVEGRLTAAASLNVSIAIGTLVTSWFLLPLLGVSAVGYAFLAMQLCGCVYVVLDLCRQRSRARVRNVGSHQEIR
ncbi:MAG: oligosaccharide flippase family protein [Mycobacterium sp.]|nr:oligosaccharide flippase family protein [Mycobacterium sp.]MBV9720870.1 oligosaccharide flippase family protein [Mycobacterium sp.]